MNRNVLRMMITIVAVTGAVACEMNNPAALPEDTGGGGGGGGGSRAGTLDSATALAAGNAIAMNLQLLNTLSRELPLLGNGSACTFNGTDRFNCPVVIFEATNLARVYMLLDDTGIPQSAFDASVTDSAVIAEAMVGTVNGPSITGSISQLGGMVLSGMGGTETSREWNGVALDTTTATVTVNSVSYAITFAAEDSVENVFVNPAPDSTAWPAAGTYVRNVTAHLTAVGSTLKDSTIARRAEVNFNGTSVVPLLMGTLSCSLHLDTRVTTCGGL